MGIENLFNTIKKNKLTADSLNIDEKINCNYLYIDFNSVIYIVSDILESDFNYYLYCLIINKKDDNCFRIEKKYNFIYDSYEEFCEYMTNDKIIDFFKYNLYLYIDNFIENLFICDNIKNIHMAFDGTPTLAKIIEKKKRRYIKYLVSVLKDNIYNRLKNTIDENRQILDKYYISINRVFNKWNICIQEIYNNLISPEYKLNIKQKCVNLINVEISSSYEFGEGEKKIMEHILNYNNSGSYVIFSPDADVVLLSLLIQNKLLKMNISNTFNLIRHNNNHDEIENISICNLRENILNTVINKMNNYRKYNYNKNNLIDDIIGLFTFFGNDFLPKIESLNIKNGINILLDIYARHLNWWRGTNIYLLFEENNITKVNYDVFTNIINKLAEYEDKLIFDKYLSSEYKNFNYLSEIFEPNTITPFFIDRLNRYCHGFNKIIRYIRLNLNTNADEIFTNVINNFSDKENFINQFIKIEGSQEESIDVETYIKSLIEKMIEKIRDTNSYRCGLKLVKYSDMISDKFHQKCMNDDLIHDDMDISDYDIEIYKLEKRLDNYRELGIDTENKIGITELKYKNSEYKIYTDKYINDKKKFFYEKIMNCYTAEAINFISKDYIKGFFWVIDHYFNKNNRNTNINNISVWYYKYDHTPYFNEIALYLDSLYNKNNELNKIFQYISDISSETFVKATDFMNSFEQYLFITPNINKIDIPEIYKNIINDDNIYIDINNIIHKILNGDKTLFDTYNTKFLNKGNIIGLKNCDYKYFMNKVSSLRTYMNDNDIFNVIL
jgi:5'-3' exonuclease